MKGAMFLLGLLLTFSIEASSGRTIAKQALRIYNQSLEANDIKQRFFEGYSKISDENCIWEKSSISCQFPVVEEDLKDEDVYTPNTLNVKVDRKTKQFFVGIEWGC